MKDKICPIKVDNKENNMDKKICPLMSRPVSLVSDDIVRVKVMCEKEKCMAWGIIKYAHAVADPSTGSILSGKNLYGCKLIEKG